MDCAEFPTAAASDPQTGVGWVAARTSTFTALRAHDKVATSKKKLLHFFIVFSNVPAREVWGLSGTARRGEHMDCAEFPTAATSDPQTGVGWVAARTSTVTGLRAQDKVATLKKSCYRFHSLAQRTGLRSLGAKWHRAPW